ncbi:MAG: D-alanine--D-alanine ligase [Proteobacteria bacterium]|nr:MAG: D-alanine--D-alanine ligase [Pseudomonadota bacterium]PIE18107.1 MAG: D-alanine--D-alanine ligase [Pseudomonadota bacterium]
MTPRRNDTSRWAPPKKVGVLAGGRSAERAVSLESGSAITAALVERGYEVQLLDIAADPCACIRGAEIDVALIALHGRWGEDGCVQGLLEAQGIPYTGSGVTASALAMDKVQSKRLFDAAGLATPPWSYPATVESCLDLGLPVILKPRAEGSSIGLGVVRDEAQLQRQLEAAAEPLLAETYVGGHELTVGVLGAGDEAVALGTLEIRPASGLYDYEAKYESDDTLYLTPAPFSEAVRARLMELALRAHRLLDCSGATRVDFRWDTPERGVTQPMLLEVNTLPGMTSHSLLPKMAELEGMNYGDLVEWILGDAGLKVR